MMTDRELMETVQGCVTAITDDDCRTCRLWAECRCDDVYGTLLKRVLAYMERKEGETHDD